MGLRYQNIDDFMFRIPAVALSGGDVVLMRAPFRGKVAGFRAIVTTALDANNVDAQIQRAADNAILSSSINIISTDVAGTTLGAAGNDTTFDRGQEIKIDLVENGAVGAGAADIILVLRKQEPGNIFDGVPRT